MFGLMNKFPVGQNALKKKICQNLKKDKDDRDEFFTEKMISFLIQVFHRDIFSSNKVLKIFLSNFFHFIFVIKIFRINSIYLEVISPFLSDQKDFFSCLHL